MTDYIEITTGTGKHAQDSTMLWDLPIRLFHWSLALSILASWITINVGWLTGHLISGITVLVLIAFRIVWGFVGSTTARFISFVTWPWIAARYLLRSLGDEHQYHGGHNPAGGYMVIALLLILITQVTTGLFSNNDLGFAGPLADTVSKDDSDSATIVHAIIFDFILLMVWLHVLAVFYYALVKRDSILNAMITGRKPLSQLPSSYEFHATCYIYALASLVVCSIVVLGYLFLP